MGVTASSRSAYRQPDGSESTSRSNAITVDPATVAANAGGILPPGLYVGIAARETNFAINEHDTDFDANGNVVDNSYGLFQSPNAGDISTDVNDFGAAMSSMQSICEGYYNQICNASGIDPSNPGNNDPFAYVCWAHNNGIGAVLQSISTYGMDWQATITRNQSAASGGDSGAQYMVNRMIPYANAVLGYIQQYPGSGSGGSDDSSGGLGCAPAAVLFAGGILAYIFGR
jgi:hypothetical protein